MDLAAWHRMLRCAGCVFMVDPDVAQGGYCCKRCRASAGMQHSALCCQEVALAWVETAAAVPPGEPVEPTFRKASKRAKASQPSVAGSPTASAEQPAKPWSIWEAERQVDVPRNILTHTRALPLPTTIVCDIDGNTCLGVYVGHGQSKIVYRLPDDRVLKLCDKRNQEADLFATWHSIGAYPIIYASNQCTVHITKIISRTHTITHQTLYGSICDYSIPLDSIVKKFPAVTDILIVRAVRAMIRVHSVGHILIDNGLYNFGW